MRARKNILYLANRVPYPPDKGDKIRSFHQMDHLARFHNVYCAAFDDTPEDISRAGTLRQWCKRLTKLTYAFSKKWGNLRAALALHFAYYNFCRIHGKLRVTPAMEARIADHVLDLRELITG